MPAQTSVIEFPHLKKSRRYGAKVKTGCITCKVRRIRCDETKPACSRCTTTGRKCDGYAQSKANHSDALDLNRASITQYIKPTLSGPADSIHYLEFYHQCAHQTLSSRFDNGFWSRLAPQLAQSEPCVRHALIAIGYLNKAEPGNLKHARSEVVHAENRKTLYFHYNKAVRSLVDRMAEASYTPEVGLVVCLLFICIEFLRGDCFAAFMHLNGGLKLLSDRQQLHVSYTSPVSLPEEFSPSPTRLWSYGSCDIIEDSIIPMFNRVATAGIIFGVRVEDLWEIRMARTPSHEQPFSSFREAQDANVAMRNPSIMFAREMGILHFHRLPATAKQFQKQAQLLDYHCYWFRAMRKLERNHSLTHEEKIIASMLHMYAHTTYVTVFCAMSVRQTPYDAHIDAFKLILDHARTVLDSTNLPSLSSSPSADSDFNRASPQPRQHPAANFTFEINVIPCLNQLAQRCRCPITRREALSLLARGLPREALWDAEQLVAMNKRVIEIEESEVDERGWPLEKARLWAAVIDPAMDSNGGFWVFFTFSECAETAGYPPYPGRKRPDAQWQEWMVL